MSERRAIQKEGVLMMLKEGPVTPFEAYKRLSCFRLAARIHDLRREGYRIKSVLVCDGDERFARYYLAEDEQRERQDCRKESG